MEFDVLFLGRLFPREYEAKIKSKMKTGMQDAANALQWNIIDGLEANDCGRIKILNYLPVDSYPNGYMDRQIEAFTFQHTEKYRADDINVGCTNLRVVKQFANASPFKHEIDKWLKQDLGMKKVMILYSAHRMFLELARYVKGCSPDIEICCIIADIPEFVTARKLSGVRKLYNDYNAKKCGKLYKYVDKFVLLTEQMAEKLNITVPHIVMEGIATGMDVCCDDTLREKYRNEKYILYTGTLNYQFGIGTLLDAFGRIRDQDVKLMICGFGEAEGLIQRKQALDDRIIYLGRVDRSQVLGLQRGAAALVNPRQNKEEFTKYSFPSKNLEYLSAGVPVVAYKLDGIPDEYDGYLLYPSGDDPEALAELLQKVCRMQEEDRYIIGTKGKHFVLENKNKNVQARRILELFT